MRKIPLIILLVAGFVIQTSAAPGKIPLEKLAREFDSPNPAQRLEAVRKIAIDYTVEGQSYLLKAATDEDEFVRERAIQGLGAGSGAQAITAIKAALKDQDEFVRWRAVQALGRLGIRNEVEAIASLIEDENWRVKVSSFEVLGTMYSQGAKAYLIAGLKDPDERVKLAASAALARNKDKAALDTLLDLLQNGSMFTRANAAVALGELDDDSAVEPLIEAVANPLNQICEEGRGWACWGAVKALVKITGQDFGRNAVKWKEWYESDNTE